ncbi:unnamed protein product [Trichogramma brassicae]|uniref:Uncharacterized protein n=1 Tax=Trichogramma brassicae TaxID=86971 RepID=A0A6H5HU18_9HYME|nr:unnamed protein product [Trichogramma brassicae]
MSLIESETHQARLHKLRVHFLNITNINTRRNEFYRVLQDWSSKVRTDRVMTRVLRDTLNTMFRTNQDKCYFLKRCLHDHDYKMLKLFGTSKLKINKVILDCGKSPLHFLAEIYNEALRFDSGKCTLQMMKYLLNNPRKNYQDKFGFTYFHGACMTGNTVAVSLLLNQADVDVNLDTYACSPLHLAVRYRHEEVIRLLLARGADPNKRDQEFATPLHALSRLSLCDCVSRDSFCDRRRPCDEIIRMLVNCGANVEARDSREETPLQAAFFVYDTELVRALLRHDASVANLDENRFFRAKFCKTAAQSYPVTLNVIEATRSLIAADFRMSISKSLRMLKYWRRARGNDIDHCISGLDDKDATLSILNQYKRILYLHDEYGFYFDQTALTHLYEQIHRYTVKAAPYANDDYEPESCFKKIWTREIDYLKSIKLNEKVSLYQLCQMSYSQGHKVLKNMRDWRCPAMEDISCNGYLPHVFVKRHVANIKIRSELEMFAADLFMSDHCSLNLPYTACRKVAEFMSDEDLYRWCEQTSEEDVGPPPRKRQRLSPRLIFSKLTINEGYFLDYSTKYNKLIWATKNTQNSAHIRQPQEDNAFDAAMKKTNVHTRHFRLCSELQERQAMKKQQLTGSIILAFAGFSFRSLVPEEQRRIFLCPRFRSESTEAWKTGKFATNETQTPEHDSVKLLHTCLCNAPI